jgi:hypothetical protein
MTKSQAEFVRLDDENKETSSFNDRGAISKFEEDFKRISSQIIPMEEKFTERYLTTAPDFNIFDILDLQRFEVKTHSAFLALLLDPRGVHGQGNLFLRTFIEMFAAKYPKYKGIAYYVGDQWNIRTELCIPNCRLDIVLRNNEHHCLFVIENKVDAHEQETQLERYWAWMKQQTRLSIKALIFLTPDGREGETATKNKYFRLSYHEDIVHWLELTLPHIKALRVKELVSQYIEVVRDL